MKAKKAVILTVCTAAVILAAGCREEKSAPPEAESAVTSPEYDVDLTELSSTMVYSEVYNMVYYPESYIGKTVKMNGMYVVYTDEETGKTYHGCVISDATACCAQGIEFDLTADYNYPEDYPSQGQEICVTGTFDTYMEGTDRYCTLRDARLVDPVRRD